MRLDPDKKRLMDNLRVIARNVFYTALEPFKKAYNNYRDDHEQFRQLTQCSGVLEVIREEIVAHLMPRVNYAPRVRRIINHWRQCLTQRAGFARWQRAAVKSASG